MYNKLCYINKIDYYLALKRNEVLICAITYINAENIVLSEKNKLQKTAHYMI